MASRRRGQLRATTARIPLPRALFVPRLSRVVLAAPARLQLPRALKRLSPAELVRIVATSTPEPGEVAPREQTRRLQKDWRECMGVEPTPRHVCDEATVLKTARTTGPYPLPGPIVAAAVLRYEPPAGRGVVSGGRARGTGDPGVSVRGGGSTSSPLSSAGLRAPCSGRSSSGGRGVGVAVGSAVGVAVRVGAAAAAGAARPAGGPPAPAATTSEFPPLASSGACLAAGELATSAPGSSRAIPGSMRLNCRGAVWAGTATDGVGVGESVRRLANPNAPSPSRANAATKGASR